MRPLEPLQIESPAFKPESHAAYARLRETAPVCRVRLANRDEAFLVARYDDVSALLRDPRFAKDPANALDPDALARMRKPPKMFAPLMRNMLGLDEPDHSRLKRLVQSAFTPRRVETLTASTQAVSTRLIDAIGASPRFDLVRDYAAPLPVTVISQLLGVPDRDRARFARWSAILTSNTMTPLRMLVSVPAIYAFMRYLRRLIADRRASPQDDLVSDLARATGAGARLEADEFVAMLAILLTAGHETTTNLIGNGMLALMRSPDQRERLRSEPDLGETAVEELLRFAGPVEMSTHRYAREDVEIAGEAIPRGSLVFGVIASANRDAQRFAEPDRLDLGRAPNRHLTFGEGGHYCVGAALARMEARIAFPDLVRRWPGLRPASDAQAWRGGLVLRGLERLPVIAGD